MTKAFISTLAAAILLTCRPAIAQDLAKGDGSAALPRPLLSFHGSTGRLDPREPNAQAIPRETANTLAGEIEGPVMTPTRSSFLAKWHAAAGATGYRLDVSTTPSFDSYVSGYKDRDIGNATNQIVSGLERGTKYYYRVRAYDTAGMGGGNSETMPAATATTTSGLVINPIFDSTITSDPRSNAIQAMIISTIQTYQTMFSDPITVSIRFRFSGFHVDGTTMGTLIGVSILVIYPI